MGKNRVEQKTLYITGFDKNGKMQTIEGVFKVSDAQLTPVDPSPAMHSALNFNHRIKPGSRLAKRLKDTPMKSAMATLSALEAGTKQYEKELAEARKREARCRRYISELGG